MTSSTHTGGGAADGNEKTSIHASSDGIADDYSQLLPPEDWGFPATQIFLGTQFDSVKSFWFTQTSGVDCFGMDSFYIEQAPPVDLPTGVTEPASLILMGLAFASLGFASRFKVAREQGISLIGEAG